MQTIKRFHHGQVFLPEPVCQAQHWKTGQELLIINLDEGILLKPKHSLKPTTLDEVAKCLPYQRSAKTLEDLEELWKPDDLAMRSEESVSTLDISFTEVDAVCGLYQATHSVSLEEMDEAKSSAKIGDFDKPQITLCPRARVGTKNTY